MIAQNSEIDGSKPLKGKRELFAQLLSANNKNQTEAYKEAGYKYFRGCRRYAHELATNPIIIARIKYLQADFARKMEINREVQAEKLQDVIKRAQIAGDLTNEVGAIREQNKLFGLITDKVQDITEKEPRKLAPHEKIECKEIAAFLLWKSLKKQSEPAEAEVSVCTFDSGSNGNSEPNMDDSEI